MLVEAAVLQPVAVHHGGAAEGAGRGGASAWRLFGQQEAAAWHALHPSKHSRRGTQAHPCLIHLKHAPARPGAELKLQAHVDAVPARPHAHTVQHGRGLLAAARQAQLGL